MRHVRTSHLLAQDDVSHPNSERELVLWSGFGVETGKLGDELVRCSVDRYLRISPLWAVGSPIQNGFSSRRQTVEIPYTGNDGADFRACWQVSQMLVRPLLKLAPLINLISSRRLKPQCNENKILVTPRITV